MRSCSATSGPKPELTPRGRSLIICAALITNGSTEQLRGHLARAKIKMA